MTFRFDKEAHLQLYPNSVKMDRKCVGEQKQELGINVLLARMFFTPFQAERKSIALLNVEIKTGQNGVKAGEVKRTISGKEGEQKSLGMFMLRFKTTPSLIKTATISPNIAWLWKNIWGDISIATRRFITLTKLKTTTDYAT